MLLQNNTVTKKKQLDSTYVVLITFYKAIMYCFYISESILDTFVYSNLQGAFDHRALSTRFDFTRLTELLLFCNIFKPNQPFFFCFLDQTCRHYHSLDKGNISALKPF